MEYGVASRGVLNLRGVCAVKSSNGILKFYMATVVKTSLHIRFHSVRFLVAFLKRVFVLRFRHLEF